MSKDSIQYHQMDITTTARFVVNGKFTPDTQGVWICFHGYGENANQQMKHVDALCDAHVVVVCVEGMHRFYTDSAHTQVGASWMTRELREADITNNIAYGNKVLQALTEMGMLATHKLGVLGFSQGGHTMCRWLSQLTREVTVSLLWGSSLPDDVLSDTKALQVINRSGLRLVVGDRDKYITSDRVDEELERLHEQGVSYDFHTFSGGHRLDDYTLRYFQARLLDDKSEY